VPDANWKLIEMPRSRFARATIMATTPSGSRETLAPPGEMSQPLSSLPLEMRLLIACSSPARAAKQIQLLVRPNLDWAKILDMAVDHDLAPLLHFNLKKVAEDSLIPKDAMQRLASLHKQCCVRAMSAFAQLQEILLRFSRERIPVIVLKGAALASLVYPKIALRPMVDLDLLVQKRDLDIADHILQQLGYGPDESYQSREWYRSEHHHLAPYTAPDRTIGVEIHHHIVSPARPVRIPIDAFWARARPAEIASVPALVLAPEDWLLSVCIHLGISKRFVRVLRDVTDAAEIIRMYAQDIDWGRLGQNAAIYGASECLYYSLWLVHLTSPVLPVESLNDSKTWTGIERIKNSCLKFLIARAVFGDSLSSPSYDLTEIIAALLEPNGFRATARMLGRRLRQRLSRFRTAQPCSRSSVLRLTVRMTSHAASSRRNLSATKRCSRPSSAL
jgi:Uncharacterised nucleotidyltransferase